MRCSDKIDCLECDATYIKQTKRQLEMNVSEYRRDINKKTMIVSQLFQSIEWSQNMNLIGRMLRF